VDEDDDDDIDDKASVRANAGTVGMSRQTSLNSLSNLYPSRQATADDGDGGGARMSTLLALLARRRQLPSPRRLSPSVTSPLNFAASPERVERLSFVTSRRAPSRSKRSRVTVSGSPLVR